MRPPVDTHLTYVGARDYIRGADLLDWFERLRHARGDTAPIQSIKQFRIVREVRQDGTWVYDGAENPAAKLDYFDAEGILRHAAFVEGDRVIVDRTPDIPSQLLDCIADGSFAGRATLARPKHFTDLLNGLIEANKKIHTETLRLRGIDPSGIRLVYVLDLPASTADIGGEVELTVACQGERRVGERRYTLCSLSADSLKTPVKICYLF